MSGQAVASYSSMHAAIFSRNLEDSTGQDGARGISYHHNVQMQTSVLKYMWCQTHIINVLLIKGGVTDNKVSVVIASV